jgi:polyhydroxybutyrate depolymerase
MTKRTRILGAVLVLLGLPPLVALFEAVDFHLRNRNNGAIVSSAETREYLLYVPESYDAGKPTPLVITLHGGKIWPALQRDMSGWNQVAESHGFIVVYPAGLDKVWRVLRPGPKIAKDVRFISDLIDELEENYNIDPTRIYANGLSNGGGMTFVLSCMLFDRVAAVGLVAGAQMLPFDWCPDQRPMPMISFHGTSDEFTPYEGGHTRVAPKSWAFPDISDWTARWARRNRCGPDPAESVVAGDVTRREYTDCAGDASVVLYTIDGGGHTWPGGEDESMPEWFLGPTSQSIDASAQMWAFFEARSLR